MGRGFVLFGRMWKVKRELISMVQRQGGTVCELELGQSLSSVSQREVFLVLADTLLTPKDSIGFEYEINDSPIAGRLLQWINEGARPLSERDLRESFTPSAVSRHREGRIETMLAKTRDAFGHTLTVLDEVIAEIERGSK